MTKMVSLTGRKIAYFQGWPALVKARLHPLIPAPCLTMPQFELYYCYSLLYISSDVVMIIINRPFGDPLGSFILY